MNLCVIICAAGASSRYAAAGGLRDKLDEDLGGRPVLQRTVEMFNKRDDVNSIIVAGPHEGFEEFRVRHGDKLAILGVRICKGGASHRYETVAAALEHVPDEATHVAVHDAARPATPPELIDRVIEAARTSDAVIPAIDVPDTIKRVESPDDLEDAGEDPIDAILGGSGKVNESLRRVVDTVPRSGLVLVQTPQVFEIGLLRRAYAQDDLDSTDDASLIERLGERVTVVEGDPRNVKITLPRDLPLVRAILGTRAPQERAAHKRF